MVKRLFEAAVHGRWGYSNMGVHKVEERGVIVRRGVVFRWVVISLVVENNDFPVELELGIGSVGGVLVRTVVRGSLRQIRGGSGEVEFEVVGEVWRAV